MDPLEKLFIKAVRKSHKGRHCLPIMFTLCLLLLYNLLCYLSVSLYPLLLELIKSVIQFLSLIFRCLKSIRVFPFLDEIHQLLLTFLILFVNKLELLIVKTVLIQVERCGLIDFYH